ncbi:MAG: MFS transporter [Rhizomicrobium sp.]
MASNEPGDSPAAKPAGRYRWYVLAVLTAALALSLLDRQILTILAGPIKADLGLSDAEIGLLYGTTFAVFYSLFGIPLGRVSDVWLRGRLMALGLIGWSAMTMFSGFAANLTQLVIARMGVGVGEATANSATYSLLSDYFPKEQRATAIALYSCGVSFGLGGSLWFGGSIVDLWQGWFGAGGAPLGLKAWQAAFVIVGLPGFLVAALLWFVREPQRGLADGLVQTETRKPFPVFLSELLAILPPLTLVNLIVHKATRRVWAVHLLVLAAIVLCAAGLIVFTNGIVPAAKRHVLFDIGGFQITGHTVQWTALGIGLYGVFSWAQTLRLRDAPAYALIFRSPAMLGLMGAASLNMVLNYGLTSWAPFYAVTTYKLSLARVGFEMGVVAASAGLIGTYLGGVLADWARRRSPRGRLYVSLVSMIGSVPIAPFMFSAPTLEIMLAWWLVLGTIVTAWIAGMAAATQELVLPRMRGTAAAALTLGMSMFGLGLGPYSVGLVSDATGDLHFAILSVYAVIPFLILCMLLAIRHVGATEANLVARARAAGESIEP